MPYHCVAYGCGKTTEEGVTLFKFPKDPEEFRKWEKQVQRTRMQWVATPNSYLCNEHFGKEYFEPRLAAGPLKLRPGAAPTVFVRPHCPSCNGAGCGSCLPSIQHRTISAEPREQTISVSSNYFGLLGGGAYTYCLQVGRLFFFLHRLDTMKWHPKSVRMLMKEVKNDI